MGYGVYRGDYYRRTYRGDPGLGSLLKKGVGLIGGIAGKVLPPPFSTVAKIATGVITGRPQPSTIMPMMPGMPQMPMMPKAMGAAAGTTRTGAPRKVRKDGKPYKRPSMNPANPRALRRAFKRQDGFVKLARKALQGTKYTIATRGRSGGSPGVITRREATRALRS